MDNFFAEIGIAPLDFVTISAFFLMTMLMLLAKEVRRHRRLNYFMVTIFVALCLLVIATRDTLETKIFTTLMMTTTLIVATVTWRQRRLEGAE